jgi:general secretion pathway protein F
MMRFKVRLLVAGSVQTVYRQALGSVELQQQLAHEGGALVLSVERCFAWPGRTRRFVLETFLQELISLLEAGLPVLECLSVLRDTASHAATRQVLQALTLQMQQGQALSRALQAQPEVFSSLLYATVASAERTGQLIPALQRYRAYEQRVALVRKTVVGALIYPLLVLSVGTLIMLFMLFFIIPRFAALFDGVQSPSWSVRAIVGWGQLLAQHSLSVVAGLSTLVVLLVLALRHAPLRMWLMARFWRLPRLSEYRLHFILARFYRSFGMLLEGGVTAYDALELIESLLPQMYRAALRQARAQLRQGVAISHALQVHGLTTAVSLRLLQISERSADLASMCARIGQFYEDTVDRAIVWFSKVFEPLLMLCVGLMVGAIVFLLYTPVFELVGGVGGAN